MLHEADRKNVAHGVWFSLSAHERSSHGALGSNDIRTVDTPKLGKARKKSPTNVGVFNLNLSIIVDTPKLGKVY